MAHRVNIEKHRRSEEITKKIHPNLKHEVREYLFYFLRVFFTVAIIFAIIRSNVFFPTSVSGISMQPNINENDIVFINLFTPKFSSYSRGDIVVVRPPGVFEKNNEQYIKRVIGLPGETIGIQDGRVIVFNDNYPDGEFIDETYIPEDTKTIAANNQSSFISDKLDNNEYYVLGDNRTNSIDSRNFGPIAKNRIIGKGFYIDSEIFEDSFIELPRYNISN